jgi:hypothetical protein
MSKDIRACGFVRIRTKTREIRFVYQKTLVNILNCDAIPVVPIMWLGSDLRIFITQDMTMK